MTLQVKLLAAAVTALAGVGILCPICGEGTQVARARAAAVPLQLSDTATVRLHISGMTCGSCPATARLALKKLAGVYRATVTLDDSLGVVSYAPNLVTPEQISAHLTRATGFRATILPDTTKTWRRSNGA
jgi:copper chaperone CopZ